MYNVWVMHLKRHSSVSRVCRAYTTYVLRMVSECVIYTLYTFAYAEQFWTCPQNTRYALRTPNIYQCMRERIYKQSWARGFASSISLHSHLKKSNIPLSFISILSDTLKPYAVVWLHFITGSVIPKYSYRQRNTVIFYCRKTTIVTTRPFP